MRAMESRKTVGPKLSFHTSNCGILLAASDLNKARNDDNFVYNVTPYHCKYRRLLSRETGATQIGR